MPSIVSSANRARKQGSATLFIWRFAAAEGKPREPHHQQQAARRLRNNHATICAELRLLRRRIGFLQKIDHADGSDVGLGGVGVVVGDGLDVIAGNGDSHLRTELLVDGIDADLPQFVGCLAAAKAE